MTHAEPITVLIVKKIKGIIRPDEETRLQEWMALSPENKEFVRQLTDPVQLGHELEEYESVKVDVETLRDQGWEKIAAELPAEAPTGFKAWRLAAAIFLLAITIGGGIWYLWIESKKITGPDSTAQRQQTKDPAPFATVERGLILTLLDGQQIDLDTCAKNLVLRQGAITLTKIADELVYQGGDNDTGSVIETHTIQTGRGRRLKLRLADGTRISVVPGSTMRYPLAADRQQRVIDLVGEALFTVASDKVRPFLVFTDGIRIEPRGTVFTVRNRPGEPVLAVLLQGEIQVSNKRNSVLVTGNHQARLKDNDSLVVENTSSRENLYWITDTLDFYNIPAHTVMRAIERWYNVETKYIGDSLKPLTTKIPLNLSLGEVKNILGALPAKVDTTGNLLTVEPTRR